MKINEIWFFNHYAFDMYRNCGGRHYNFAKQLIAKGYSVTIFCANVAHNSNDKIDITKGRYKICYKDGINFVFIKTVSATNNGWQRILNMIIFSFNLMLSGVEIKKRNILRKPDIIISSSVHPLTLVVGNKLANKFRIPSICEIRDLWPEAIFMFDKAKENSILGKILIWGEKNIYENADNLIFTKEGDVDYLKERGWLVQYGGKISKEKCHYINNGVIISDFNNFKKEYEINDPLLNKNSFKIIYTGAIRPINNVGKIIDVAKELSRRGIGNIDFYIYGEGSEKDKLEQRAESEAKNVHFMGKIDKKFIPSILSKSNINLLIYSSEKYNWSRGNSSNKLFEYLASGKPIITNVKMGYSIIQKYKCGMESEFDTAESIADCIQKIYSNKLLQEEMSMNSIDAASDFDYSVLTNHLIEVINETGEIFYEGRSSSCIND